MTGILIVLTVTALLIAALAPAHRRARVPFRPGADLTADHDRRRLIDDLAAADQRRLRGARRTARLRGAAGSAGPFHRAAPRVSLR